MKKRSLFGFDLIIFLAAISLIIIGVIFIYSSNITATGELVTNEHIKQIIWALIGLVFLAAVFITDYAVFRNIALYLYIGSILLLVFTLLFGKTVNYAKSWIGILDVGIQPSEFAKIATIIFLAWFYETRRKDIERIDTFFIGMLICMLPAVLILLQPDMGTALVYIPIFLTVSFVLGTKKRYVLYVFMIILFTLILALLPTWENYIYQGKIPVIQLLHNIDHLLIIILITFLITALSIAGILFLKKYYFYWIAYGFSTLLISLSGSLVARIFFLSDYQAKRLLIFLKPEVDEKGFAYHALNSQIAIGSGGLSGKGWLNGPQSHGKYVPEQSSDFIFSIIAEEWGFIGSLIIMLLYMIILVRMIMILFAAKDNFSIGLVAGVLAMLSFHFFINIGMAIGIMPVTGIPVFFLSYGGSSLMTAMIGIGLVLNVYMRRYNN